MTTDTIKISQEINFNGLPTWISVGGTLTPGEDVLDGLRQLQKSITDYHAEEAKKYQSHNWAKSEPPYPDKQVDKPTPKDNMITAITTCTEVATLETFRKLAASKPEFQKAFDNRLKELQP